MKKTSMVLMIVLTLSAGVQAGVYLHLTADDLALDDGAEVTSWTDSVSGNVLEGTASYAANWNGTGKGAVYFNGTSDALYDHSLAGYNGAGGTPDTASLTLFVVGQFATVDTSADYMVSCQDMVTDASGDNRLRLATGGSDWRHRVGDGSNQDGGTYDTDAHIFTIVSGQDATNATKMLVDGTVVKTGTHGSTANCLDLSRVNLGTYHSSPTNGPKDFANCYIAEILIYDGALTDSEIADISASLNAKYVPEPATMALLGMGGFVTLLSRRRQ